MNRQCGDCTLCCKLLPVVEGVMVDGIAEPTNFNKPAGQRCEHQCAGGCRVYRTRRMPEACRLWNCRWIIGELPRAMRRPDRVHYVVDMMPDFIVREDNETGEKIEVPVVQIWCDPDYPDAHRDPDLRAWLEAERHCALVRFSDVDARFLAPPTVNAAGVWFEHESRCTEPQHSAEEILASTGGHVEVEVEATAI